MKKLIISVLVLTLMITVVSCKKRDQGALIGGTAGATIGAVIGNKAGNTALGAILGAAIGGAAGAYIGNYMDKQAAEIERDLEGATIERVGEGIKITFDSGILFDVNKAKLQPVAEDNLSKLAVILNKYPETEILIEGHTDSDGSEEYNMDLSMKRANAVSSHLSIENVSAARFHSVGYGEIQPIADNSTPQGKTLNRRVEIAIFANDKLKGVAEKQVNN